MRIFAFLICFLSLQAQANVTGTHLQNFNPTTSGFDFVTVHSTQTLAPGTFNVNGFSNFAINSLPFFKAPGIPNTQKFSEPNDKLLSADLNFGIGLMDGWDLGMSLPFVVSQTADRSLQLGTFDEEGLTEIRFNTKVSLVQAVGWGVAMVGSVNFDRIKNNPFTGGDPGPTWNLEGVFDYKISETMKWAFNLGYRLRDEGDAIFDSGVSPMSDQIIYSTALSYWMPEWDTTFIFELYGSSPVDSTSIPTDRELSNLEFLAGAKYAVNSSYDVHAGVTTETYHGLATPDFRFYLGLNARLGSFWNRPAPEPIAVVEAPAPPPSAPVEEPPSEVITLGAINFETESSQMTASSRAGVRKTAEQIRRNKTPLRKIIVEGHADNTGTHEFNQKLSDKRAQAVRTVLLQELRMQSEQIEARGFGETKPLASNDSTSGRTKNRRVELKIYRDE